jgi:hypothetical protein
METYKINDFKDGWFVGDFEPSILKCNFEVGIKKFFAGYVSVKHKHILSKEINVILYGVVDVDGLILSDGDIFVFDCGEVSSVKFIKDTCIIVVKSGSYKYVMVVIDE